MSECGCGRPADGAFICSSCTRALEIALGNISSYWADLDNVKGRLTRYGGMGGRPGAEKPLPVDARFLGAYEDGSMLQEAVKNTVSTWTRIVMEERPALSGPVHPACLHVTCSTVRRSWWPADTVSSCCRYLLGHAGWVRTKVWASEILDELDNLEAQLRRMVDRPADKWFAGPCEQCERDLYAKPGAALVVCVDCDLSYEVAARRDWLWQQAQETNATAAEISRAFSWLNGTPLTDTRIRKWVERKRLTVRGHIEVRGRTAPIYRIGDVAALLESADRPKAG
jgi:hypothetical protein